MLFSKFFDRKKRESQTAALSPDRPVVRAGYLRDTRSRVIDSRPAVLRHDHAEDVKVAWRRTAALALDLIQNSGRLRGAADQVIADTVGSELVLQPVPDLRPLGYSPEETDRFAARTRRHWKFWSWNPRECDQRGKLTVPQMVDIALRHYLAYGEAVGVFSHFPAEDRQRYGIRTGTKFCLQNPQRLVQDSEDLTRLNSGIIHDEAGRPLAYRFRLRKDGADQEKDYPASMNGRTVVLHVYEPQDAGDVRGISPLAAAFRRHIQHEILEDTTLQSAILQTVFAATLTSANPSAEAFEAIETLGGNLKDDYHDYFMATMERAAEGKISISGDPQVSHLAPGEELKIVRSETPGPQYQPFSASLARDMARALGVTYGSLTLDYTSATYSSTRMEMSSIWPVVLRRRERIAAPFAQAIYENWLDEEIGSGRLYLKGGYEAFREHRDRIGWAQWRGPAQPTADDLKSAKAASERLKNGTSSIQVEAALNGLDDAELFEQRRREHELYTSAGLPSPYQQSAGRGQSNGGRDDDDVDAQ